MTAISQYAVEISLNLLTIDGRHHQAVIEAAGDALDDVDASRSSFAGWTTMTTSRRPFSPGAGEAFIDDLVRRLARAANGPCEFVVRFGQAMPDSSLRGHAHRRYFSSADHAARLAAIARAA
jgi:hypothetical protein